MTAQEFKNDHLTAVMESLPHCVMRVKAKVSSEKTQEYRSKALKAVNKEVTISGFRPGKAPENLVQAQYGKHVEKEFRDIACRFTVADFIQSSKIYPIKKEESVSLEKFEEQGKEIEIVFQYETFPTIPEVDFNALEVSPHTAEDVKDQEIEKTLKEIQIYHAKWNDISDRAAKEGDFVVIDIDVIDEPAFRAYENSRFHMIENGMPKWARDLVIGLSVGESKEGISEKDKEEEGEFVPRQCRVTLNLIQEADLPPVDDELAKKAGVDTVETLRVNIRKQMENEKKMAATQATREDVRNLLTSTYPMELPATDLKNLENNCREILNRDKEFLKSAEELAEHKEKILEGGKKVIQLAYLIPSLANQLGVVEPTEAESNNRMIEVLTQYYIKTHEQVPEDQYAGIWQKIQRDLMMEKTLDALIEKLIEKKTA